MLELVDLILEDRQGVNCDKFYKMEITEGVNAGKRDDHQSKKRRLYLKMIDQCLVY